MDRSSKLFKFGAPMIIVVLVLVVAIAQVGAGDQGDRNDTEADMNDEYQVEQVSIESVSVNIAESYPVQVFVNIQGYLPDPCWESQEPIVEQDGNRFEVDIVAERKADEICPQVIEDYEHNLGLGSPDPGNYVVSVNGVEREFEVY